MRRQVTDCKKIFAEDTADKWLLDKIYKELLKLNNKKTTNHIKNRPKTLTHIIKEDIHMTNKHASHVHLLKSLNYGTLTTPNAGEDVEQHELWNIVDGNAILLQPLCKTVWQFLTKLNLLLPYDPEIMLLSIYPKELKRYVHTKTYTWMFIAALLIIINT